MSDANIIIMVQLICTTIIAVVTLLTRKDVNGLKPEIVDVRAQLVEANATISKQNASILSLRDELAHSRPIVSKEKFDSDYSASPPYTKPLPKT